VFDSDDIVFAWAIGKALLILIVSIGTLIYIAWVAARKMEISARAGIHENGALNSSVVKASNVSSIGPEKTGAAEDEEDDTRNSKQPAPAA
jgi:hypothetical protein